MFNDFDRDFLDFENEDWASLDDIFGDEEDEHEEDEDAFWYYFLNQGDF